MKYTIQPGIINRQICKPYKKKKINKKNRPSYFHHYLHSHLHHLGDGYLADTEDYEYNELSSQNYIVKLTMSNLKL